MFDWIHGACAFRPEPPLCFFFYSSQSWCIVQGLDANWHKFQCCMTRVVQILARKSVPSETAVCLSACGTSRIQLFNWRYSQHLRQSCKTRMIHVFTPQIWDSNSPQNSKSSIFNFFSDQNYPANRAQKPAIRTQKPRISALMCFDKMYFTAAKLGLNGKFFWFRKVGQPLADTPIGWLLTA